MRVKESKKEEEVSTPADAPGITSLAKAAKTGDV